MNKITTVFTLVLLMLVFRGYTQTVSVGSGSYTTVFPGVDAANRNTYPSGTPQLSGNAFGRPVPTNDWWSKLIKENHADNLFNYPLAMRTVNKGLVVNYVVPASGANGSSQPMGPDEPIVVGVVGLNAAKANVSDFSDWTVSINWNSSPNNFTATLGIAMPFLYFEKDAADVAQITVNLGTVLINNEILIITDSQQGADFAVYAPEGSTWTKNGNTYTSTLNQKNYWSMAFLPPSTGSSPAVVSEYKKYAYVFPVNTTANWSYNEASAKMRTVFTVETDVKEGTETNVLLGLLPHQWAHLAPDSPVPTGYSYSSIRGEIKTLIGNTFTVENTFSGILPTLPNTAINSQGFDPALLNAKIEQMENEGLAEWTDSYNQGQEMNRLIQTARIAQQMGNTEAFDKLFNTIKNRLEDWLKADAGEVAFLFYYNSDWSTLIGYPAGHGQDGNLNDHHFHWGYFIHAAAFIEQFQPGWASQWGEMINLLVRDAASPNRNDDAFPFLRNFSPYAGHCWANGFATFPFGNDQESSSESMQFNSSLIHWGTVTGNKEIRDLGIYLYTTEQTAIEEYWFDINKRTFKSGYNFSLASRIWGNGYDNQTFWTSDIAAAYGIEMYPMHGGSLYLAHNKDYVQKLWNEIIANTGILSNAVNPNLWHDVMWSYLAFINPQEAINLYNSFPNRQLKFGISDAQTYHWLHTFNTLGAVESSITADYPIAAAFNKNGEITYVAHNYSDVTITVTFSDGFQLVVPPKSMATNKDAQVSGIISTDFDQAHTYSNATLKVSVNGSGVSNVEFYEGAKLLGSKAEAPYFFKTPRLQAGIHHYYAKIYVGNSVAATNIISLQVGEQMPFSGTASTIPGTIEAGHFDSYEGGQGQYIAYFDATTWNEGGFRETEMVDASLKATEGATVGWVVAGEWLEYTVNVAQNGVYNFDFRYASNNTVSRGPFYLEMDGKRVCSDISVSSTGNWDTWQTKTVQNIELTAGIHVLRIVFVGGEFNLGKMTFTRTGDLSYTPPIANAGSNFTVLLPATTANLDGSNSTDAGGKTLTYNWTQVYGPSIAQFSDATIASPAVSSLEEGIYKFRLTVDNGSHTAWSEVLVIVSDGQNVPPTAQILSPGTNTSFFSGKPIEIKAAASDFDGSVVSVAFYAGTEKMGEATQSPYVFVWNNAPIGNHALTAVATDNNGAQTTSDVVNIEVKQAPSCYQVASNGDYAYLFSDATSSPTVTFIPLNGNAGVPICILYIGTNPNSLPGMNVTPNSPYQTSFKQGETAYLYYTYSFNGMEKNTANAKHTYVVGTCIAPAKSNDASLLALSVNGTPVSGFNTDTLVYNIELAAGTTTIPTVTATANHAKATIKITNPTALPGITTVLVTAEDGTTRTYSLHFTVAVPKSNDATLSAISVNGTSVPNFNASTLTYTFVLPVGTTAMPTVVATANYAKATVSITYPAALPGEVTILVTAEDASTKTYTINLSVATTSVFSNTNQLVHLYASGNMVIAECMPEAINGSIQIFDMQGKELVSQTIRGAYEQISITTKGMVLVKVLDVNNKILKVSKLYVH